MYLKRIKIRIEEKFTKIKLRKDIYGFQIQINTKFNKGLCSIEIANLENVFGFNFPNIYKEMLLEFNGFDKDEISIDPDKNDGIKFRSFFYKYPVDIDESRWLINGINEFIDEVRLVLSESCFDVSKIIGYIPIYSHRALVVFEDKNLSPVISVWGPDIILYGNNLNEYLENEFLRS